MISRQLVLAVSILALAQVGSPAKAQQAAPASAFSFAAYGDSRPMMYLPQKDGKPDLVKCSSRCSAW